MSLGEGALAAVLVTVAAAIKRKATISIRALVEAAVFGCLLAALCFCGISSQAVAAHPQWWPSQFERSPEITIRAALNVIKEASQNSGPHEFSASDSEKDLMRKLAKEIFGAGVDGCAFIHSLGELTASEQNSAAAFAELALDDTWQSEDFQLAQREINALGQTAPIDPFIKFLKGMYEFRFLSSLHIKRLSEASDKVQGDRKVGEDMSQKRTPQNKRREFFTAMHQRQFFNLLEKKGVINGARQKLRAMHRREPDIGLPDVRDELSDDRPSTRIMDYAQRHLSNDPEHNTPEDIAVVAAYQLAILLHLRDWKPTDLINERDAVSYSPDTRKEDSEAIMNSHVHQSFGADLPRSFKDLTDAQIIWLNVLGAAGVYRALHADQVTLWNSISEQEGVYWQGSLTAQERQTSEDLEKEFSSDDKHFALAFNNYRVASWAANQFTFLYREQRIAEAAAEISAKRHDAKIAIVFGALHDFQAAFARVQQRTGLRFQLSRASWLAREWYEGPRVEAGASTEVQMIAANQMRKVSPSDMAAFTEEPAIALATRKLLSSVDQSQNGPDAKNLQLYKRLVAVAKADFQSYHPGSDDVVQRFNVVVDRVLDDVVKRAQ
jgi:hypothetical protein